MNISEASMMPEVVKIFTTRDIPGENQIGGIIKDEELLADTQVHFCGMPVALVIANTDAAAKAAVKKIKMEVESLEIITDPRVAKEKGELIIP
ncbi:MAG TPA: xanthine dehydrogenase, partial [Chitinophagaceae bacterium]|nr:xanthine dehydrogenase [Chitinophagaceae bacterium]